MTTSRNTQEQTVTTATSTAQIATYGARRATDHEIAAANAWVAHWSEDWADDDDADDARQAEYEHALEILVFANGGRDKPAPEVDTHWGVDHGGDVGVLRYDTEPVARHAAQVRGLPVKVRVQTLGPWCDAASS